MKLDKAGYDLIIAFEGMELTPYEDSAGIPTIGVGNTFYPNGVKVKMTDPPITKAKAIEMFVIIADKFAAKVSALITKPVTQNQFNAVVSFAYNVGLGNLTSSTLLKKLNKNPNDSSIADEFRKWNKAGGVVLKGLVNRRQKEANIYFNY